MAPRRTGCAHTEQRPSAKAGVVLCSAWPRVHSHLGGFSGRLVRLAGAGALPLDEDKAQQSEWRGEQDDISGEGDEVADGEFTVDGLQAAVEQHECEAETRQ